MKKVLILVLPLVVGCKTNVRTVVEYRDSVRTEVVERVEFVPDTVNIEIEREVEKVVFKDTVSELRNRYARSKAQILPDGYLLHTLESIPQTIAVERPQKIVYKDRIVYRNRVQKQTEVKEVAKPLTWWQKTRIYGFYALVLLLAFKYRRKILALIGK